MYEAAVNACGQSSRSACELFVISVAAATVWHDSRCVKNQDKESRITTDPLRLHPRLLPLRLATHRLRTATASAPFPLAKMPPGKSAARHHGRSAIPVAIASVRQLSPFPPSLLRQSSSDNSRSASYRPRRTAVSASPHRATDRPAPHRLGH